MWTVRAPAGREVVVVSAYRVELWSCGGGRQSAGIAALIVEGQLPKPDHVAMVALEREVRTVWPYVNRYIRPALAAIGVPFTAIPRSAYATVNFFGGADGCSVLLPVHTNQSGTAGKLPEFCSNEWKRRVVTRWAAEQADWKARGVNVWVGISWNERDRRRVPQRAWLQPVYPLLDMRATDLSGCLAAVERVGWPPPPRSRCMFCPNQSDAEWRELTAEEFLEACAIDDQIRAVDPHAFLHKALIPLRDVTLDSTADEGLFTGGCSAGLCF